MPAAVRTVVFGMVVAAALVLGVTSAGAADLVANPSFTDDCAGVPCHWRLVTPTGGAQTISRATDTFHSAPASLALTITPAGGTTGEVHSDCFAVSPSTTYNFSVWYRNTSASTTQITLYLLAYSDGACGGSFGGAAMATAMPPGTAGVFTRLGGTDTTPSNVHSVLVALQSFCSSGCTNTTTNYDDVDVSIPPPTAVTLRRFTARPTGRAVALAWRTGSEAGLAGFAIERARGSVFSRITSGIPAGHTGQGNSYRFVDRTAQAGESYVYRLLGVDLTGRTTELARTTNPTRTAR
jgi:hypothetical protein